MAETTTTTAATSNTTQAPFSNVSLYVGDLDPDVTEAQLYEKFSSCGQILLAKLCRDKITRQSLGYAYVNFSQPADAERALDTLNFELLNNRPMRIMWSNRDPALRRSGVGNVFIKNLDKAIDNKALYDTFSTFGNIISCKIMSDESGSKGYGFVHFETQEAAVNSIKNVNNMLLNGKKVYVGHFIPKHDRASSEDTAPKKFTNVFVKNFSDSLDDQKLNDLFSKYGEITSVKISKDQNGNSLGFGFINFKDADDAAKAVKEMNDYLLSNEKKLFVGRFQKKNERLAELKKKYEEKKLERLKKYQGVNLFIKNLDDKIDDERLKKEFSAFGTITSAKVMTENDRSKGFGFVCFSAPEEAAKAVTEMNGRIVGTKPLYVALAQRKEDRKKILTAQFRERFQNSQYYIQAINNSGNPNVYYSIPPQNINQTRYLNPGLASGTIGAYPSYNPSAGIRPQAIPRWQLSSVQRNNQNDSNPYNQQSYYPQAQSSQQQYSQGLDQVNNNQIRPNRSQGNNYMRPQFNPQQKQINAAYNLGNMNQTRFIAQQYGNPYPQQVMVNNKAVNNKIKPNQPNVPQQQLLNPNLNLPVNIPGQEPLTLTELSSAQPQQQKQMLGERLYPLIHAISPDLAGKITGMLLEIDNAELLHMLDTPESLRAKVDEALTVLQNHQEKQLQQQGAK